MCGIAGVVRPDADVDPGRLAACSRLLAHRGPDDHGFLGWRPGAAARSGDDVEVARGARVGLAHRRLSILDLSTAGWQPMSSSDGRLHLLFNGEIYNFSELRDELVAAGHGFTSTGDTEVLLQALGRWGIAALPRLVGMFAIALLDTAANRLLLARDPFGIKPLYYHADRDQIAFASEIRALLELVRSPPRANPTPLYHYLRFGITDHGPETLLAGIRQVPPAHHLTIGLADGRVSEPEAYWDPTRAPQLDLSFAEAARRLRELVLDSVRLHLRSDVPVGAALSGGIDSSSIVAAIREVGGPGIDIHTVSYVADDPRLSEARWIEDAASGVGATQHLVRPQPGELAEDLERLIDAQSEPFSSTSMYAQYRVFQAARSNGLKVMLDGQGADELLGGYRFFLAARLLSLLRRGRLRAAAVLWRRALDLPEVRGRDLLSWLGSHLVPRPLEGLVRRAAGVPLAPPWLATEWFADADIGVSPLPRCRSRQAVRELVLTTVQRTSLPMLLRFEDRSSMAHSVESRVPFLTTALAELALGLPEEYLVDPDGTSKAILREAMRGLVPDAILDRRDKIGFATPQLDWLGRLRPWVEEVLGGDTAASLPVLRGDVMRAEWRAILDGRRPHGWHVWRWLNLIRWVERFGVRFDG